MGNMFEWAKFERLFEFNRGIEDVFERDPLVLDFLGRQVSTVY